MKNLIILALGIIFLLIFFSYCAVQKSKAESQMNVNGNDYEKAWKLIDSLDNQGMPKTALEETEKLLARARKDGNGPQTIKSIIYRGKFQSQLEEDGLENAIFRTQQEVASSTFPSKAVLQSILAEMYSKYLISNSWKLRDRTTTSDFKNEDIRTWTPDQITKKSIELYNASIADGSTKNIPIQEFKPILNYAETDEQHRPTLYDFLEHRALEYFMNEQTYLTEPAYKFYIDQKEAFGDINTFTSFKFESKDSFSLKLFALKRFQDLIKFHISDTNPVALIDANLKRLQFVHNNSILPDKEQLYLDRLEKMQQRYKDHPSATEIAHSIAMVHYNRGMKYQPSPTEENKFELKKAYEICEAALGRFPDSYGAKGCRNLQKQILRKELSATSERVILPNKPFLAKIGYRNISKSYLKIVPISEEQTRRMQRQNSWDRVGTLNAIKSLKSWTLDLPDDGDYQAHSAEISIEGLKSGQYALMVADNPDFNFKEKGVYYFLFQASGLAYLSRNDHNGNRGFYLVDRISGQPLEGVQGEFFIISYNNKTRSNQEILESKSKTDIRGYVQPNIRENQSFKAKFTYKDDELYLDDSYYNYRMNDNSKVSVQTTFFLDRAIYRPGQTVYFKGIVLERDKSQMPVIKTNFTTTITFFDANYQKVEDVQVRTNQYGTFNGSFTAPQGGLLGTMSLHCSVSGARQYFSVEEYKRPKFEVTFEPVKGSYKLGDQIKVAGKAKAYAGNNIDGAKVSYRVVRQTRFPYWKWWYWGWFNPFQREDMEIANGYTQTNENGEFEISFEAIPDKSVPADQKPEFYYSITADVIDITGETHSGSAGVSAGYIALLADISVPDQINRDAIPPFKLKTENLNGEFEAADVHVTIHKLKSPSRIYHERYWDAPDKYLIPESEFNRDYPHLAYKNEDQMSKWPDEREVMDTKLNTKTSKEVAIGKINLQPGAYKVVLKAKDKYGEPIEVIRFFTLYDLKSKEVPANQANWVLFEKLKAEPGEKVPVYFGSAFDPAHVLFEVEHDGKIVSSDWEKPNHVKSRTLDILEKHRGNVHIHISSVHQNRAYLDQRSISVPWSNKDLKIEYGTFRNKLYPGQDEEWVIKISGPKGEKVAAEMVAALYDESLDAFAVNSWNFSPFPYQYIQRRMEKGTGFSAVYGVLVADQWNPSGENLFRSHSSLNWFGLNFYGAYYFRNKNMRNNMGPGEVQTMMPSAVLEESLVVDAETSAAPVPKDALGDLNDSDNKSAEAPAEKGEGKASGGFDQVKVRTNLNETVFFFPELRTDPDGNIIIKFKMNEALTRWKFLGFASTSDLKFGLTENHVVTQKELMIVPNVPRFLRESDEVFMTAKVSNLTENDIHGAAVLEIFDAITMKSVNEEFENTGIQQRFMAPKGQSAPLSWRIKVPLGARPLVYRVIARSDEFSDGEENAVPVLTNRMMITETLPLPVRGNQTKKFQFSAMEKADKSNTLSHHSLTLEFTSNPAWYAVQALPYLMEYPYECTEQIFSRYYANSLATAVANSHPKVKQVFVQWKNTDAMLSNLSKNEELKTALLEETPWVLDAQNEEQQKKRIGLLFDLNKMANEQEVALRKMAERQLGNGGFAWFPGGRDDWYITQYIVEGMGHLDRLGVKSLKEDPVSRNMAEQAVKYIDDRIAERYEELKTRSGHEKIDLSQDHLDYMAIHYLYARSFFLSMPVSGKAKEAAAFYLGQADKYWLNKSIYMQGLLALALQRSDKMETPGKIVKSLKERSLYKEEMGMYWKYNTGYYWYQYPIETHAVMIEVFDEVAKDAKAVEDLKVWMLKNKQTTNWKTTKATASAVYALLLRGDNWLMEDAPVQIKIGDFRVEPIFPGAFDVDPNPKVVKPQMEAGTGYFKTKWSGKEIKNNMANIEVTNPNKVVAWGALYWQYFEQLDKIATFEETPLTLNKKVFREENSPTGPVIRPVTSETKLAPGDKLKVRIELRVDRDMEYVHMKDMRASGLEPINVMSSYKWQGGLGYYESTRDAATNFFFSYLPKGTYVFEYPLRANLKGDFSNGVTTIQCMYAPEFTSHSEGIRIQVE